MKFYQSERQRINYLTYVRAYNDFAGDMKLQKTFIDSYKNRQIPACALPQLRKVIMSRKPQLLSEKRKYDLAKERLNDEA